MVDVTEGNPGSHGENGGIPVHMAQSLAYMRTAKALQDGKKHIGGPAAMMLRQYLCEGEIYAAEDPGRILIVHRGMLEEAQVMKASLDAALDEDEESEEV